MESLSSNPPLLQGFLQRLQVWAKCPLSDSSDSWAGSPGFHDPALPTELGREFSLSRLGSLVSMLQHPPSSPAPCRPSREWLPVLLPWMLAYLTVSGSVMDKAHLLGDSVVDRTGLAVFNVDGTNEQVVGDVVQQQRCGQWCASLWP